MAPETMQTEQKSGTPAWGCLYIYKQGALSSHPWPVQPFLIQNQVALMTRSPVRFRLALVMISMTLYLMPLC